jgi:hypothetical protein
LSDEDGKQYDFIKAIVYARDIDVKEQPKAGSSRHRQQYAKLACGYFVIEQRWGTPPKKRVVSRG